MPRRYDRLRQDGDPSRQRLLLEPSDGHSQAMPLLLTLLTLIGVPHFAQAHNGAVAIAYPVNGIVIDGDLQDWPEGMTRYAIGGHFVNHPLYSPQDYKAWFQIGYGAGENTLYIAVQVQDDFLARQYQGFPNSQDGCEIFYEAAHNPGNVQSTQYWLWGETAGNSRVGSISAVEVQVKWGGQGYSYEWRVPLATPSIGLEAGQVLGFDIALWDKDADESAAYMMWGDGFDKPDRSDFLGDLLLAGKDAALATLSGHMRWEDDGAPAIRSYVNVYVHSVAKSRLQFKTDHNGNFRLDLPAGLYRMASIIDRSASADIPVELPLAKDARVALVAPIPQGDRTKPEKSISRRISGGSHSGYWQQLGVEDGLPISAITALLQDRQGHIWLGTERHGVSRYNGARLTTFTTEDGLASNNVTALAEDHKGNLWIGTDEGVSRYDGAYLSRFTREDGLVHNQINALVTDQQGLLWIGTNTGLSRYDGAHFTTFTTRDGLADYYISSIELDQQGLLWIGTGKGLNQYDGKRFTIFTRQDGLVDDYITALFAEDQTKLWIATEKGFSYYNRLVAK